MSILSKKQYSMPTILRTTVQIHRATEDHQGSNNESASLGLVIGICVVLIIIASLGAYTAARRRDHHITSRAHDIHPPVTLAREALKHIPLSRFGEPLMNCGQPTGTPASGESNSCVICTEAFVLGNKIRRLPCGHSFHDRCIDRWLTVRAMTCPLWFVQLTLAVDWKS